MKKRKDTNALLKRLKTVPLLISKKNIENQIALFLYSMKSLQDSQEVVNMEFGDMTLDLIPVKVFVKEVKVH